MNTEALSIFTGINTCSIGEVVTLAEGASIEVMRLWRGNFEIPPDRYDLRLQKGQILSVLNASQEGVIVRGFVPDINTSPHTEIWFKAHIAGETRVSR